MRKVLVVSFFSILAIFLLVGSATAVPVYYGSYVDMYLKENTFPDNLSEEKVYLDAALASTITGHVGSQTGTPLVTFSSTTDILDAANGFATIKAQDGYLNNITITAPGYYFDDLIFSVNLTPNNNTDLEVTVVTAEGNSNFFNDWSSANGWVNGENRILILANTDDLIFSITIESMIGILDFGGGIDQIKQTEISGLTPIDGVTPVPEPATMLLLGSGLIGLAGFGRKKLFR